MSSAAPDDVLPLLRQRGRSPDPAALEGLMRGVGGGPRGAGRTGMGRTVRPPARRRYDRATPTLITVDLWATDYRFAAGHRIGLHITSSSFPRWQRALNVDEPLGQAVSSKPSRQRIFVGGDYPSRLRIGARR